MKVNPKLAIAITLLFLPFAFTAKGQYYPGGLGNGNLFLWLDANNSSSITQNAGNQVSQWADLSGNGFNFSQATLAKMPVYGAAASPTARPGLSFSEASSQYLSTANLPATFSFTTGVSVFTQVSYNAQLGTNGWQRIFDFANGASSNNIITGRHSSAANTYYEGWNGGTGDQTYTTTNDLSNGTEALYESIQQPGAAGTLTAVAFYLSGTNQAANGQAGSSKTYIPQAIARTSNYIGRSNWATDEYFGGTMSEILLYNTACNTTQRVILENYLSAKWNQTVSVTKYTPPGATTYTTNLIGIGYTSAADNFLTDIATSTDGLGFSSGATATDFLGSPGYLMAAHNGQANTILSNIAVTGIGASVDYWNRSWYLNTTGGNSGGTVTLNFNFANYNGSALPGASNYFLVWNATDGSFATGTNQLVAVNTSSAGSTVSFAVKASSLVNGYYTIMWPSSAGQVNPSTVTLCAGNNTSFSVSSISGCSYQWQVNTGSGFGNVPATDPGGAVYSGSGSTTLTITGLTSSMNGYTYQVLLSSPNGPAITEGPATLTVNPIPVAAALAATADPVCAGSSTTLSITGPVAGVTYNIYSDPALTVPVGALTSAANALVVSPAATTTYYEQAVETATGCVQTSASQNITVTVNPAPAAETLAATASPICSGSSTTLSITGPVAGVTYNIYSDPALTVPVGSLTSAANTLVVSPAATTTYYEQAVETATGCEQTTASQTITVTVNPVPAGQAPAASANPICAGGSTTLSITGPVAGVTYHIYSDPALTVSVGTLTSAANALVVSPAAMTTYYEQAVGTATGCVQTSASQNITVTVNPVPAGQALAASASPICASSSTTLSIAGPVAGVDYHIYSDPALTVLVGTLTSAVNALVVSPVATTTYYEQAVETATGCVQTSASQTITVTVNPAPAGATLAVTADPVCAGSSTTLSITGPVAGVTYNIYSDPALTVLAGTLTSAANTLVLSPAATTTYYEQAVETATGCVQTAASQNITVTVNPVPAGQALAASADPICSGSSTTLSITGPVAGVTYNIYSDPALTVLVGTLTSAANALVVSPVATTTYYEQAVETATGCVQTTASQTITVTVNPAPAAAALAVTADPVCAGSSTTLSITGPVVGVTYNIYSDPALTVLVGTLTSAANALVLSPAATTTYYEQAVETATGCIQTAASQNITVTVNPVPAGQALAASADPICSGSSTTLSIATPVAGVTYNIYSDPALTVNVGTLTSAANTLVVSPAATTIYYEQAVETTTGCVQTTASQTITVTVNPVPAGQALTASADPICAGSSTTLSITGPIAGVDYRIYSDPALTVLVGTLTSAANTLVVSPAATTAYYEQAVETATGCVQTSANQSITVTVNPVPAAQALAAASPICTGSSTTLSITGPVAGVTYNIYGDPALTVNVGTLTSVGNALIVIPAATTTYYEQAETALGCLQTAPVQSTVVTLNANPVLTTVANPVLCIGLPDTLSATAPGAQVTWLGYDPGDSIIVSPATTTTYVAVAENAANCTDTAIITVQVIDFKISLTASPDPIVAGFPVSLVATSSMPYQAISWEPSGQFPDQTASTQTFTIIDTSQTFSVTGINDNGCLDTASITVVVQPNLGDFFIPNAFTPNGDGRNDVFMVYGSSIRDIDIRIFNQWGQLVFESQDAQRGWDGSYGGHQQPAGVYLYVIKVDLYGQPRTIYKKGSLNLIR